MYHDTDREERSSMIEMMEAEYDSLGEMTEAEYGVLGEAAEAEYGICDLLDENIPSPLETDNAGETLVLPEIQDMTEYIRRHYEQEIMKKLAWRLRWEELCVVSDGKYYQDLPWTGSEDYGEEVSLPDPEDVIPKDFDDPHFADEKIHYATLLPKDVKIVFASYYRVSECCVEARLTVEAQVEIRWRFLGKTVPQRYDVDMWFDMEGDMNGEICQIALHRYRSEASGVKLDEYLVPVFHWEDIEEEAERIIADLVTEGLSDPLRLRPYPFAERLGLKIVSLPLYKRPKTASILFFGPGDVLAGSSADAPSVSVAVEANTIVLNSHLSGRQRQGGAPAPDGRAAVLPAHADVQPGGRQEAAGGIPAAVQRPHHDVPGHAVAQPAAGKIRRRHVVKPVGTDVPQDKVSKAVRQGLPNSPLPLYFFLTTVKVRLYLLRKSPPFP